MNYSLENSNPHVYQKSEQRTWTLDDGRDDVVDEIDNREIFDAIRGIKGWALKYVGNVDYYFFKHRVG